MDKSRAQKLDFINFKYLLFSAHDRDINHPKRSNKILFYEFYYIKTTLQKSAIYIKKVQNEIKINVITSILY